MRNIIRMRLKKDFSSKLAFVKIIKDCTGLGLKEAKDVIDKTPAVIKEDASKEEADKIKSKLEEVGAKVEIK